MSLMTSTVLLRMTYWTLRQPLPMYSFMPSLAKSEIVSVVVFLSQFTDFSHMEKINITTFAVLNGLMPIVSSLILVVHSNLGTPPLLPSHLFSLLLPPYTLSFLPSYPPFPPLSPHPFLNPSSLFSLPFLTPPGPLFPPFATFSFPSPTPSLPQFNWTENLRHYGRLGGFDVNTSAPVNVLTPVHFLVQLNDLISNTDTV